MREKRKEGEKRKIERITEWMKKERIKEIRNKEIERKRKKIVSKREWLNGPI